MSTKQTTIFDATGAGCPRKRRAAMPLDRPVLFNYEHLWRHSQPLLDFMAARYGDRQLDELGGSYGWPVRYRQVEDYAKLNVDTLADYIAAFKQGGTKLPYLRHLSLNRAMPLLRKHIADPREFGPNWVSAPWLDRLGGPELFIGQAGTVFGNIHQDQVGVHVGFVQLQGEKEIVVFPPEDGRYLYRIQGAQFPFELRNSRLRLDNINNHEKFPLARHASPRRIVLRAGQAMFLPSDWWHTTRNLSDSVSYNIRIVNASNAGRTLLRHIQGVPRWIKRGCKAPPA